MLAQGWLVLELTGSGRALGVTLALQTLPILVLGAWGGVLADRVDNRRLLAVTALLGMAQAIALGVMEATGNVTVHWIYLFAFVLGVVTAFDRPAMQAMNYELAGPQRSAERDRHREHDQLGGTALVPRSRASSSQPSAWRRIFPEHAHVRSRHRRGGGDPRRRDVPTYVRCEAGRGSATGSRTSGTSPHCVHDGGHGGSGHLCLQLRHHRALDDSLRIRRVAGCARNRPGRWWHRLRPRWVGRRLVLPAHHSACSASSPWRSVRVIRAHSTAPGVALFAVLSLPLGIASAVFSTVDQTVLRRESAPEYQGRVMSLFTIAWMGTTPIGGLIAGAVIDQSSATRRARSRRHRHAAVGTRRHHGQPPSEFELAEAEAYAAADVAGDAAAVNVG